MPRARRIYLEDAVYYVALEGPSHEALFREKADYLKYVELLSKYKNEYQFNLFSYVLLPEQIFLLIEPSEQFPLSQVMQKITPTYTKYYNEKYDRAGHLFQKRYRSVYVEKESSLLRVSRFIHRLPERLKVANSINEYPYSSFPIFMKSGQASSFLNLHEEENELMEYMISSGNGNNFDQFVLSQTEEEYEFLEKKLSWGTVLGTEQFEEDVKKRIKEVTQKKELESQSAKAAVSSNSLSFKSAILPISGLFVATIVFGVYSYLNVPQEVASVTPATQKAEQKSEPISTPALVVPTLPEEADLEGTFWDVQLINVSEGEEEIKDRIKFTGNGFESYYFLNQGFTPSNYTVTLNQSGVITWETIQHNEKGETITWRGDWNGQQLEGVMSYHPQGKTPQDFSFMSGNVRGSNG